MGVSGAVIKKRREGILLLQSSLLSHRFSSLLLRYGVTNRFFSWVYTINGPPRLRFCVCVDVVSVDRDKTPD